jgi:tRNA nucleotidyltransferase (CCA-adding enzyme)
MATGEDARAADLAGLLQRSLPSELMGILHETGELASGLGQKLYLVGGVVRDLLLGRSSLDLDLVVEGEALKLAAALAEHYPGRWVAHRRFGTAKLRHGNWSIDLATARSESYSRPGALPTVRPGTIQEDLFRRDFTINAMAVHLDPAHYGELLDPYGGKRDLEAGLIRILHQKSFIDDATRMFRALRYEQRLGFRLEQSTETRLRQDVALLDTISADRIRHELELIFKEERPELALRRAGELGLLGVLLSGLGGNGWLAEKFAQARKSCHPTTPPIPLYLALLVYRLTETDVERFMQRINPMANLAQVLRETIRLKGQQESLEAEKLAPSAVFHLLGGYSLEAVQANALATSSERAKEWLELYLNKLHHIKPSLNGEALLALGVAPGPRMGQILQALQDARLDGKVENEQQEKALVKEWLKGRLLDE